MNGDMNIEIIGESTIHSSAAAQCYNTAFTAVLEMIIATGVPPPEVEREGKPAVVVFFPVPVFECVRCGVSSVSGDLYTKRPTLPR
jgi:hypothetical protein